MGERKITIYDIAKELGLNPSTVSRTFSNPDIVSEKTRNLVFQKAEEMGYQVNRIASQLRSQSSHIIALVSLEPEWSWFTSTMANGVQQCANRLGYDVVVLTMGKEHVDSVRFCEQMRFSGVIVASTELGNETGHTASLIPTVYVNRLNVEKNSILPDDIFGINQAMDLLHKNGHQKIGYINGPKTSIHSSIRFDAYCKRMKKFGCPLKEEWLGVGNWSSALAYDEATRIFSEKNRPTALMVADDTMCIGVYRAAYDMGIEIGNDISIIGYDNTEVAEVLHPELTTVALPLYEMGVAAVEMLTAIIEKKTYNKKEIIRGQLIVRKSVKNLLMET